MVHKLLPLLFVCLIANCQNEPPGRSSLASDSKETKQGVCSTAPKVVKVPQGFPTIDDALAGNAVAQTSNASPTPSPSPIPRLRIEVSSKDGGYLMNKGLTVERPCTEIVGISAEGKKPILRREEFGEYEQPVIKIAAHDVLLKGFEIRGKYTTNADSSPSGVLVLIRKEQTDIPGYANISIEENDINNIGYQYPADLSKCWEKGDSGEAEYKCGGGHGIEIKSNTSNPITKITVRGNKIHDLHLGKDEALTISNNVYDFTVADNEIFDVDNIGIDIAGFQDHSAFAATKGQVVSNRVYKSNAKDNPGQLHTYPWIAGIYIDGGHGLDLQEGALLVERNLVFDYGFGIEIGAEHSGEKVENLVVQNNLLFRNWIVGIGVGHDSSDQKSYLENTIIRNNTLYQNYRNGADAGELRLTKNKGAKEPFKNIRYENNLIATAGSNRCLVYADVKPELEKFDVTFANNLFVGTASTFWKCGQLNFQQFSSLTSISLQNNEYKSDFPFEKELPADPALIISAIRAGTIKDFFKPKAFAAGRGISW
jgi:hypothetical protein